MRLVSLALLFTVAGIAQTQARLHAIGVNTADRDVELRFWTALLPCAESNGQVDCGETKVLLSNQAPSGGSAGTIVNHIGFFVRSIEPYFEKASAAGYKYTRIATGNQIIIDGPDGVRVELTSDTNATAAIRFHHVHFSTPDPKGMQAWYAKVLGATPGKRAQWEAGDLPNANLTYAQANGPVEPTKGRAIAGVEFEVENVHRIGDMLRALGVECAEMAEQNGLYSAIHGSFTDPWGTSVTLIQAQH